MPYGTVNADVIGTSVAGSNLGAGDASLMKNRIINGAMVIDQRNAGASVTASGSYPVDRFQYQNDSDATVTWQQSSTAPVGFANSLSATITTADASVGASQYSMITQRIEGYNIADLNFGTANAKTVTISFWVQSSVTGTYGGVINNDGSARSYPFTYTISSANTWEQKSVTIAGDTSGTWLKTNGVGFQVRWALGMGSSLAGTAGSWSTNTYFGATGGTNLISTAGATFYITGVQLEVGSSATGFEYVNYQTSLANCQRYFISYGGDTAYERFANCINTSTTQAIGMVSFPTSMRTTPSVSSSGSIGVYNGSAITSVTSIAIDAAAPKITTVAFNVASGLSANAYTQAIANASTATRLTFSAEL